MRCSKCGVELEDGVKFCWKCGNKTDTPKIRICRHCGTRISNPVKFCYSCGASIETENEDYKDTSKTEEFMAEQECDEQPDDWDEEEIQNNDCTEKNVEPEVSSVKSSGKSNEHKAKHKMNSEKYTRTDRQTGFVFVGIAALMLIIMIFSIRQDKVTTKSVDPSVTGTVSSNMIKIDDVTGMSVTDAVIVLEKANAENIKTNIEEFDGWNKDKLIVVKQSVPGGTEINADKEIILTCKRLCQVYLDLKSEMNLFFSTYDMDIYLDGKHLGTVSNGKQFTQLMELLEGDYTVYAYKESNNGVKASYELDVSGNMTFSSNISHGGSIEFKNAKISDEIIGAAIEVPDVTGMILKIAVDQLSELGFVNVIGEPYGDIWDKNNWLVLEQNVAAGTETDKNTEITLTCMKTSVANSYAYIAENATDISANLMAAIVGAYTGADGGYLLFYDNNTADYFWKSGSSFNATGCPWVYSNGKIAVKIDSLGCDIYADISGTATDQLYFASNSLLWKNEYFTKQNNEPIPPIVEPETTAATAQTEAVRMPIDTNKKTEAETTEPSAAAESENVMPVMTGRNLDEVLEKAASYGVTELFDDDFGHGTRFKALQNKKGGLTLDVIYSSSTKEILAGNIVTFTGLSTATEQKEFIKGMAEVLCPPSDSKEVAAWVRSNVGKQKDTTIQDIVYSVGSGPTGNLLYDAGTSNWEDWDLAVNR